MKKCKIYRAALQHNQPFKEPLSQKQFQAYDVHKEFRLGNALRFAHAIGKFVD